MKNVKITICKYTKKPIVQEKFGNEWVCVHFDTAREDREHVNKVKSGNYGK